MKASDHVAAFLAANGVRTVYEMTGGMITHLLDSIRDRGEIEIVSVHHEQAAAFAAEGGARLTGVPGVALATSGPGATNLITGIGSCYFDSVPAVFITGQVNTHELRGTSGVRQAGFQEADIVSMVSAITKGAWQVASATELPDLLAKAFALALEGRPGPVLLDIPMDVQRTDVTEEVAMVAAPARLGPDSVADLLGALAQAERPLILAGGGVRAAGAAGFLREFAELTGVPVVSSLMGLDVLPHAHPLRAGFIGTYGNRWANLAMRDADRLLVLGARLDVRQTGADLQGFRAGKTILRVDVDPSQLAWRVAGDVQLRCDLGAFLESALAAVPVQGWPRRPEWFETIAAYKRAWPDEAEVADCRGINPAVAMRLLSESAGDAAAFVLDVGQNQMWAAQSLRLGEGQRAFTAGGMGAMGFALPAGIGAAMSAEGRPVVCVTGDGGMQVNIQELETISRLALPLKIVVVNNHCLGMVRQFQDEYFGARYQSTLWGYGSPDFVAVSAAYGIPARKVDDPSALAAAARWLMLEQPGPALLELSLDSTSRVTPKVTFGNCVYVMDPAPDGSVTH